MAVPPVNNEAFLREVDEEYRRDQMIGLWKRYGVAAAIGVVVLLAAVAAYLFWRASQHRAAEEAAVKLQDAYDAWGANKLPEANRDFAALAQSKAQGYRVSALYSQGDILLAKGDLKGAAAKFAAVANDGSVAQPFRDLALVRQTTAEYDTLKPEVVVQRLKGLAAPGNPWFGSAGEMVAVAYLRQGKRELAAKLFGEIAKDGDVPESLKQRAVQMAGVLGVDAVGGDVKAK